MRTRGRFAVIAVSVVALVALFFVAKLILSDDTLLLEHVSERRTTLTKMALWAGADPNFRDEAGRSALSIAVALGDSDIAEVLVDAGADANARTSDGEPVVAIAVRSGETGILAMLLDAGADPNAVDGAGIAVLVWAVIHGEAEIPQVLLDAGADPNTLAAEGVSVLAKAVELGDIEVVRLLVDAGADPNGPGVVELAARSGITVKGSATLSEALDNIGQFVHGMLCLFGMDNGAGC